MIVIIRRITDKKIICVIAMLIFIVMLTSGCGQLPSRVNNTIKDVAKTESNEQSSKDKVVTSNVNGMLEVHFINVGQADSIFIKQADKTMLIDGANNEDGQLIKQYINDLGVNNLDIVVGTHAHADHIGGLSYVMNAFKVGKVYFPKQTATSKTFENFVLATKKQELKFTNPVVGDTFKLGDATCTILAPNGSKYEDANDYSIVLKLEYGQNSFLLTGDAEKLSEQEIVKKGLDLKADVLKVAHHGSRTSSSKEFIDKVNPKYAIISCGKDNSYGHPHSETISRLNNKGIKIFRTDENGNIVAKSDGKNIIFSSDK
jgi:competence protein ComEC